MNSRTKKQLNIEKTTTENRHWVRLTDLCNNACLFCLDSDDRDYHKKHLLLRDIKQDLEKGIKNGASRAILSGGEASVHPDFIKIIRTAKELGYRHVQVISNGRMFCYKKFLTYSVNSGLNEITFSIHGDSSELHDRLTGIQGSFKQATTGLKNALNISSLIVSVDVCVNKMNYKRLYIIIAKLIGMGVSEFDLLHVVPFGRAWRNKDSMLYDLKKAAPYIRKALEFSKDKKIHIWTNRFPAPYLEDYEDLIQDPYKIHSEIKGQRKIMDKFTENGELMECYGERCKNCYMNDFCKSLIYWKNKINSNNLEKIFIDLDICDNQFLKNLLSRLDVKYIYLTSKSLKDIIKLVVSLKINNVELAIDVKDGLNNPEELKKICSNSNKITLALNRKQDFKILNNNNFLYYININQETSKFIKNNIKKIEEKRDKICFFYKSHLLLSGSTKESINLRIFFKKLFKLSQKSYNAINMPFCYNKNLNIKNIKIFDLLVLNKNFNIDIHKFVDFFIKNELLVKRLSCNKCAYDSQCNGMNINYIRNFGFKNLGPKK